MCSGGWQLVFWGGVVDIGNSMCLKSVDIGNTTCLKLVDIGNRACLKLVDIGEIWLMISKRRTIFIVKTHHIYC